MATLLTYEDFGILPIKDFDYKNYDKVKLYLCRIGVVIVEVVTRVTLLKDLGALKLFARFITSAGSKQRHWTYQIMLTGQIHQLTQPMIRS